MTTILELEKINKSYRNNILSDLDYKFPDKGFYAIYGASGSGKSTLLNIIAGFEAPDSGSIHKTFDHLEYVMQEHMLLTNISVKENMYLKLNVTDHPVDQYDAIILDTCRKLSIDGLIEEKVSFLSGGEKQRVSIARALLSAPDIILLDEPTASIDYEVKEDLLILLLKLSKERLIIVSTHDPVVKDYADTTLSLERGTF
ncbi:ATP-binding cassette domain-containing protein [Rossellomorea sp. SC111]|uniref:ATP-binding cassette domain-containing protein n=1 Tax=Rossellomorea sp. SC111 TaxID=2968985 RepID=UPI00215A5B8D|nr:ATP-binding cassette domain-containing protein [Rossellomorea sp. SC111]MCR8848206.1 ATP-binding cassette domain-containing protein [Rossellomorea sp. SC111]